MQTTKTICMTALCAVAILLPTVALSVGTASAQQGDSSFELYGEDGDLITAGEDISFAESEDVAMHVTVAENGLFVTVIANDRWYVDMVAPGGAGLRVGQIVDAALYPLQSPGEGGFHVYGGGRDCVKVDAQFVVRELRFDVLGDVESAAIDFTQSCNDGPRVLGGVRINSTFQAAPQAPEVPGGDGPTQQIRGDVNCDGRLNVTDSLSIAQFAVGNRTASSTCPLANPRTQIYAPGADLNRDGAINVTDAVLIGQCSVGLDNGYCD